jgi:hypothetical protein
MFAVGFLLDVWFPGGFIHGHPKFLETMHIWIYEVPGHADIPFWDQLFCKSRVARWQVRESVKEHDAVF